MIIQYDDSHAGNGKTTRAISKMVSTPGQYIYSCERRETYPEIVHQINAASDCAGTIPKIIEIKSGNSNTATTSVRRRIEALPDEPASDHAIALITHAALMMCDFSSFHGWSLVIDEVPPLLSINHVRTDTSIKILRDLYHLNSRGDGWSDISLTAEGKSRSHSDIVSDDFSDLSNFHRAVQSTHAGGGNMIARLENWDVSKQKWFYAHWFSFWSLSAFSEISVLGNQFTESVDVRLVRHYDEMIAETRGETIDWVALSKPVTAISPKKRRIRIQFFDHDHASATKFKKPEGARNLVKVAAYLSSVLPQNAIWSGNNGEQHGVSVIDVMSPSMPIAPLSPRQAGSNEFRTSHAAAIIYTANASTECQAFLALSGQSADDWRESKEHETILQFVTRTSIRDPNCNHDVNLYVYDKFDAEYLVTYFEKLGHDVLAEYVDLDLEVQPDGRATNGRKASALSIDEKFMNVFAEHKRHGKTTFADREIKKGECGDGRLDPAFPRRPAKEVKIVLGRLREAGHIIERRVRAGNGRQVSEYDFIA